VSSHPVFPGARANKALQPRAIGVILSGHISFAGLSLSISFIASGLMPKPSSDVALRHGVSPS